MMEEDLKTKEKLSVRKYGALAYSEEMILPEEAIELIDKRINDRLKELMIPEKKIHIARERMMKLYDVWTGLLAFITFVSAYFTATLTLPPVPGILIFIASFVTLILFISSMGR